MGRKHLKNAFYDHQNVCVSELCVHVPFQALFLRQVSRVIFRARSRVNFLIFKHRQNNNNNTMKVTYVL